MAEVTLTIKGANETAAAFAGVKKGAKEAFDSVKRSGVEVSDRLQNAFKTLGIKSASDMDAAKSKINKSFDSIKNSGVATADEIVRAERARASEIEKIDKESFSKREGMLSKFKSHWLGITGAIVIAAAAISPLINIVGTLEEGWIGVAKTTGMAGEKMADFKKEIRELSTELKGVKIESLQEIATTAGQLGIRGAENISNFTEIIAKISVATNLTAEQAAADFAKITNVMHEPISNIETLASVMNELSNSSNAYASDISNLTKRMSGAGSTIKLTTGELMALSATMKDLGVETEVGATAMSKMMTMMLTKTKKFASATGLSFDDFADKVANKPMVALKMLITQLSKLDKFERAAALKEMGLAADRVGGVVMKLSGGMDKLDKHLKTVNSELKKGTSIQIEYETASKSMFAEATSVSNAFKIIADELAEGFLPAIKEVMKWVRLSAVGLLKLGKSIGIAMADISLGFRNIHQEPTKLERLNNSIKMVTKGIVTLRKEGRFPTALLHNEEKLNKLLAERQRLMDSGKKTATTATAPPKKIKSEVDIKAEAEANKKALKEEQKYLQKRLNIHENYFTKLKGWQAKAKSDQDRLAKDILDLEKKIAGQRQGYAEMMAAMNKTAFGDSRTEMQKYYEEQDRLDDKLAVAMQLSGQAKINALVKYQKASASAAQEVKEDGEIIIGLEFSTMEAMERVEEAQLKIVAAQETLLEKKREEKTAIDAWIDTLDSAMKRAKTAVEDYQKQIVELQTKMSSLGMEVDNDQATQAIDKVMFALSAIPDVTKKTIYLETITSGGGPVTASGASSAPASSGGGSADPGAPFGTFSLTGEPKAIGTSYIPKTGIYQLHQGETVSNRNEVSQKNSKSEKKVYNFGDIIIKESSNVKQTARELWKEIKRMEAMST